MKADRRLYPTEDAERFFASLARKPYRPSNGTEGEIFMSVWCSDCVRDYVNGCQIVPATMALDVDHPDYPTEWVYGADGQPKCTGHAGTHEAANRCPNTPDLFGAFSEPEKEGK